MGRLALSDQTQNDHDERCVAAKPKPKPAVTATSMVPPYRAVTPALTVPESSRGGGHGFPHLAGDILWHYSRHAGCWGNVETGGLR